MAVAPVSMSDASAVLAFLAELAAEVSRLQNPTGPTKVWACVEADLPTAAATYANAGAIVTDKACLAICTYNGSAWAWTRADGSAL